MEIDQLKQDIITASHILHRQGIAAAFGHVSARICIAPSLRKKPRIERGIISAA